MYTFTWHTHHAVRITPLCQQALPQTSAKPKQLCTGSRLPTHSTCALSSLPSASAASVLHIVAHQGWSMIVDADP